MSVTQSSRKERHFGPAGPAQPPACVLCPREGGALKRCRGGRWAHGACALWVPETALDPRSGLVEGLDCVPKVGAWRLRPSTGSVMGRENISSSRAA